MFELPYRLPTIINKRLKDPHVVIIGAGASKAACPTDKNGNTVALLRDIHEVLGLTDKLKSYGFSESELSNFELLFSNINNKSEYGGLQKELEDAVHNYFQKLMIPDDVTLYDYLVLSLTDKDAIISFNWDPFLVQAYRRNIDVGNLPQLIFPHGNVGVGICYDCKIKGYANSLCNNCFKPFSDMPLLFPVGRKNYYDNSIIENEWNIAKNYLIRAAGVTIFGYSAPETDVEAYQLLKNSYQKSRITSIAPFTIINLAKNKQEQKAKWQEIYNDRMLQYTDDFRNTILWESPRVSLETLFDAILQQQPRHIEKSFKDFDTLEELQTFVKTIDEFDMAV